MFCARSISAMGAHLSLQLPRKEIVFGADAGGSAVVCLALLCFALLVFALLCFPLLCFASAGHRGVTFLSFHSRLKYSVHVKSFMGAIVRGRGFVVLCSALFC